VADLVCLDTNVVIWGIRHQASPGQEINILRAKYLIDCLLKEKKQVMLPAVVVGEAAVRISPEERPRFFSVVSERFRVAPFDMLSAIKYSPLLLERFQEKQAENLIKSEENGKSWRRAIKADCMILATALAYGANRIYTEDGGLTNLAAPHIIVSGLPEVPPQPIPLPLK